MTYFTQKQYKIINTVSSQNVWWTYLQNFQWHNHSNFQSVLNKYRKQNLESLLQLTKIKQAQCLSILIKEEQTYRP